MLCPRQKLPCIYPGYPAPALPSHMAYQVPAVMWGSVETRVHSFPPHARVATHTLLDHPPARSLCKLHVAASRVCVWDRGRDQYVRSAFKVPWDSCCVLQQEKTEVHWHQEDQQLSSLTWASHPLECVKDSPKGKLHLGGGRGQGGVWN